MNEISEELSLLVEQARDHPMSDAERFDQAVEVAYERIERLKATITELTTAVELALRYDDYTSMAPDDAKRALCADIVKLCRDVDRHQDAIRSLITQIEESGHSHAAGMARALLDQCHQPASAAHVIHRHLYDHTRWEQRDGSLYHVAASKAAESRKETNG